MKNKSITRGGQTHLQCAVGDFVFGENRIIYLEGETIPKANDIKPEVITNLSSLSITSNHEFVGSFYNQLLNSNY